MVSSSCQKSIGSLGSCRFSKGSQTTTGVSFVSGGLGCLHFCWQKCFLLIIFNAALISVINDGASHSTSFYSSSKSFFSSFTPVFARDAKNKVQHQSVAPMKIYVDNQNDHPPKIADCPRDLFVLEEQDQPVIATFNAHDDDKSVNGVISFSLKSDPDTSNGE